MQNSNNQKRIEEFDITRTIAIISVVLIHVTAIPVSQLSKDSFSFDLFLVLNRLLQFAVPLFILISSVVATYTMRNVPKINWKDFYQKKLIRIVVPYIIWTMIYVVKNSLQNHDYLIKLLDIKSIAYLFLLGKAHPHLYYMIILIQFFVFFPLLLFFVKKLPRQFPFVILITFGIQIAEYWLYRIVIQDFFRYPATLYITYLFISLIGIWIGLHYEDLKILWPRYKIFLYLICALSGIYYIYMCFRIEKKMYINTFYYQMTWDIFVTGISLIIWKASAVINKRRFLVNYYIKKIGDLSFGLYFIHPIILWMLFTFLNLLKISNIYLYILLILIIFILTMIISIILISVLHNCPYLSWIVGIKTTRKEKLENIHQTVRSDIEKP